MEASSKMQTGRASLIHHELIGLPTSVAYSTNQSQVGISGVMVDETRNTVTLETKVGTKTIEKRNALFTFQLDGIPVSIEGVKILLRPHERVSGLARGVGK